MMQLLQLVVLGLMATLLAGPLITAADDFVETGECPEDKNTEDSYKYTLNELKLEDGQDAVTTICTVLIKCEKAGTFGQAKAFLYDMVVTNIAISGDTTAPSDEEGGDDDDEDSEDGEDDKEEDGTQLTFESIRNDWFKFVQKENGSIPAVFHSRSGDQMSIDLKKAIATSFQTNFKGTPTAEETDTQSKHNTEYSYKATAQELKDGSMVVHKRVVSNDVEEYATHVPGDVVDLDKEEDQVFDHGRLTRASGDTSVKIMPQDETDDDDDDESSDVEGESLEGDMEDRRKKREVGMSEFFDFLSDAQSDDESDDESESPTTSEPPTDIDTGIGDDDDNTGEDVSYVYGDEDFAIEQGMSDPADVTETEDGDEEDEEQDSEEPVDKSSYDTDNDLPDFSAKATYTIKLVGQRKLLNRERRNAVNHLALPEATQSTLLGVTNHTEEDLDHMEDLRSKLKDITSALDEIHTDPDGKSAIIHNMVDLIILEAVYGSLPQYQPVINDVIAYLPKLIDSMDERDCQMRALIYLMLSRDSGSAAQKTLVDALDTAVNEDEEKTIVAYIAFTQHPQPQMISDIEKRIGGNVHNTDPLLLAYGALVARASPEVQQKMTLFLIKRLPTAETNISSLMHHIFSLGNTESHLTTDSLLDYLNHPEEVVQISSIHALRYATGDALVQKTLNDLVTRSNVTVDQLSAVLHSLLSGVEHSVYNHTQPPFNLELALSLTSSVIDFEDTEVHRLLVSYLKQVDCEDARHLLTLLTTPISKEEHSNTTRLRRGSNWAQSNSVYNLVASLSSRRSDIRTFPKHKAFIWGKKIGVKKVNLQVGAGGFIGAARDGQYKVFGRARAVGQLFKKKKTLLDFLVLRQKTRSSTHTRVYAQIGSKTLININIRSASTVCKRYSKSLFRNNRFLVFDFSYGVRIVIASLKAGVTGYVKLTSNLYVEFCEKVGSLTAEAGLESTITLEVRAGVTGRLMRIARGGVEVAGYINYKLTPALSTEVCLTNYKIRVKNCIGIYHQWANNRIAFEVWYQYKKIKWFKTTWKAKKYVKALTKTWNLGSSRKKALWRKCDRSFVCQATGSRGVPGQRPVPTRRPPRRPRGPRIVYRGRG